MKIKYRREPDGAIHVIECGSGKKYKQIIGHLSVFRVQEFYTLNTKEYPYVLYLTAKASTKRKAYQQLYNLELKLARKLKSPNVTIVRTFHDTYYKEAQGYPNKPVFMNYIERAVCIYSIKDDSK